MLKVAVFNQEGSSIGEIELNEAVFGVTPHKQLMFEMVRLQRASWRQGTHKVKGRSEVRGGGKKPWRQKGTGRARQGSIRSPQWRGGGVVFGPTPRKYGFSMNRKEARIALKSALSSKVIGEEIIVLDKISFEAPKTKDMLKVLDNLNTSKKVLLVVDEVTKNVELSARNIQGIKIVDSTGINVYDILNCDNLVVTQPALKAIEEVLG
jgi:50S ribosomal protein L4, bacterial/organelle